MTRETFDQRKEKNVASIALQNATAPARNPRTASQYIGRDAFVDPNALPKPASKPTLGAEAEIECPRHLAKKAKVV